jgi:multiple sugar transport system substrate-binding protein
MFSSSERKFSRRDFLRITAASAAIGPFFLFPGRASASQKRLKVAKWAHFLPEYDDWFVHTLAREWGLQNDTRVTVDNIPVENISAVASAEAAAGKGHDVFIFPWPPSIYYKSLIDHTDVYHQISTKYGMVTKFGYKSTYIPQTKTFFAVCDSWIPLTFIYNLDYWMGKNGSGALGPLHYSGLLAESARIKADHGVPCGLPLTHTLESNVALHSLLYSFHCIVIDQYGTLILDKGARTGTAINYVKALYNRAGSPDLLTWGSAGNVNAMLTRKASCTFNGISLVRQAEKQDPALAKKLWVQPPLKGRGGVGSVPHVTNCPAIWKFAGNREGAKKFVADLIDHSGTGYEMSQGCNFPIYQKTLPNLIVRLQKDQHSVPADKFEPLKDAGYWTKNIGVPAYSTPAAMEIFTSYLIPRMFIAAVTGRMSTEDAVAAAGVEAQGVIDKWNAA